MTERAVIRGALVSIDGVGALLRGPSGIGKSYAALGLMSRGHLLVADEFVVVRESDRGELVGTGLEDKVRTEIRGLGIFKAESIFPGRTAESCRIDFIADLDRYDPDRDVGRTQPETGETEILGHRLLTIRAPIPAGVDPALLVEALAGYYRETYALEGT